ncbi:MAG: malate dehydrogenase [Planctomycetales bacterium]|nr:malate dehydrogenase [Planctomycetales bacterium]
MARPKVSIVGAGAVGATAAHWLAERGVADVHLVDIIEGLPQGKALDLQEAAPLRGYDARVTGANNYDGVAGSAVVVVTAGIPRKPGMTRLDLLKVNTGIVGGVVAEVSKRARDAILVMVTNPLDMMTYLAMRKSGFPKTRVTGMAGVLDSARFRTFIALELNVSVKDVDAMVLGGHGDSMVPLPRYSTVSGVPITELLPQERIEALVKRTREGGAEIVNLLKQGSAFYAPGLSIVEMVQGFLLEERRLLPCCCWLEGEYGLNGVFAGVPAILSRGGVEKVVELKLTDSERAMLTKSAEEVRTGQADVDKILAG